MLLIHSMAQHCVSVEHTGTDCEAGLNGNKTLTAHGSEVRTMACLPNLT